MGKKAVPGAILFATGVSLVVSLLYTFPDAGQGGPGAAWALSVVALRGGGGVLAAGLGLYSVLRDRVRLPTVVVAAYGAVGVVYLAVRFMLFPALSVPLFTALAAAFVVLVCAGAFTLTDLQRWDAARADSGRSGR